MNKENMKKEGWAKERVAPEIDVVGKKCSNETNVRLCNTRKFSVVWPMSHVAAMVFFQNYKKCI